MRRRSPPAVVIEAAKNSSDRYLNVPILGRFGTRTTQIFSTQVDTESE
jgi:hypothetical protein